MRKILSILILSFFLNFDAHSQKYSVGQQIHKDFELMLKAKKNHLLDIDKYISGNKTINNDKEITKQLKQLGDLYKSGVLSKEEFEKAKKKILN